MMLPNRRTFMKAALGGIAGMSLPQAGRIATNRLTDNLVVLAGAGANVVAMTTTDGVVMVDGGPAEYSAAVLAAVAALPGAGRVHTLFNTHWHPEQTGSNLTLGKAGVTIIAHENTRLWLATDITRPWEKKTFPPMAKEGRPNKTFYEKGTATVGGERVDYGYMLQAHTDGDIYVFFPKANVLVTGGVVSNDGWPLVDWWTGGWIGGLANGLDTLVKVANADTRIVPANGPVMTKTDLQVHQEMYRTISTRLQQLIRKGRSPDEAIAAQPTKEFNDRMGNPDMFIRLAFQSMWGQLTPDA
jgi:cyclase